MRYNIVLSLSVVNLDNNGQLCDPIKENFYITAIYYYTPHAARQKLTHLTL